LALYFFYVFDVDTLIVGLFEDDGAVFGEGVEGGFVVEGEWWDYYADAGSG